VNALQIVILVIVVFFTALFSVFLLLAIVASLNRRVRRWCCDHMDWHDGNGAALGFDGCSMTGRCSTCGRRVLMSSQGDWFAAGIQDELQQFQDESLEYIEGRK
jgi:hypothetical protein